LRREISFFHGFAQQWKCAIQIIKAKIDYSQLLVRQVLLFLNFLHFCQDAFGLSAPVGNPITETQHRPTIGFVLRIDRLKYLGGFLNATERDINDSMHIFSAGIIRLFACQPIQTDVSPIKLTGIILRPTVIHDGCA